METTVTTSTADQTDLPDQQTKPQELPVHELKVQARELTIENSIGELDAAAERMALSPAWPVSVIETTNPKVAGREIEVIDANTGENPHYKAFFVLNNWADRYKELVVGGKEPKDYSWESKGSHSKLDSMYAETKSTGVTLEDGTEIFLIQDVERPVYDGIVEVRIPKNVDTDVQTRARNVGTALEAALQLLTGFGIKTEGRLHNVPDVDKTAAYIEHGMLQHGPLTPEKAVELERQVNLTRVSPSHVAYIDGSENGGLGPEYNFRHRMSRLESLERALVGGQICSNLQRLKQGDITHFNRADTFSGGGDMVFTYLDEGYPIHETRQPVVIIDGRISRRLDVRAYAADAYGQTDNATATPISEAIGREPITGFGSGKHAMESRRHPVKDHEELSSVHEVDFKSSIATTDIVKIVLPNIAYDESSYNDFDWFNIVGEELKRQGIRWDDASVVDIREQDVKERWGNEQAVLDYLVNDLHMDPDRADLLTTGMNIDARQRLIMRLEKQGVSEINGRPLAEVIEYGPTLEEYRRMIGVA